MKGTNGPARRLALTAMLALTLGTFAGVHPVTAQAGVIVAPPPRAGFVWAPGYWFWNGRAHAWHDGYWVRERPGYHWVADTWVARGPHYHYQRGHWER
jgi:hypothetical protein